LNGEAIAIRNDGDQVDVVAVLRVIWRYKFFIALVAAVCGLAAVALALTTKHVFRADVVVTEANDETMGGVSSLANEFGGLASIAGIKLGNDKMGYEAQAVLRSRRLVEEFLRRNDLVREFGARAPGEPTLWFAVRDFREKVLSIETDEDSGTTTIGMEWTDPEVAARWANDFVALANEMIRTRALDESSRNIRFLNDQIAKTSSVEVQKVMYGLIENETKTHMLANVRQEYAFTVVDPAVAPELRIWPRRTLMVLTGGVLGVILGVLLALAHSAWRWYRANR
jgi:uncharacterized protein involved in exopolysaccharide biosynthesis